jgi:dipeptidyl aminopeptidase/acylaminoacyl peptidase
MPRKILTLFACLSLAAAVAAAAQPAAADGGGKRAFEITDYYRTAFVGGPAVSPDGSRVAVAVTRYDFDAGSNHSNLWMMAADGSDRRQMTTGGHHDGSPVFTPDGKSLAFVSDRSDTSQVWIMPVDGGEPRQLTDFPAGVSDPVFSPDGRWLAVTSQVYPECGADADCNRDMAADDDEGKLDVHVADGLLYRHWTEWRDGRYSHVLLADAKSGEVVQDLTPGEWDSPTFSLGGGRGYDFTPDGKALVYVSNHDDDPATSTNADLWLVEIDPPMAKDAGMEKDAGEKDAGEADAAAMAPEATNLTAANHGWDGAPLVSPDGRWIAYLSQQTPGYESDLYRLALYDRRAGTTRYLTGPDNFDDWIDDMAWAADGASLVFQGERDGRTPLFRIGVGADGAAGAVDQLFTHAYLDGWELLPGGDVVYTRRSIGEPSEVFRRALSGGGPTRLTTFNADLEAEVDIRPAEEMWVQGAGDYKVQVFIVKPHDFDPSKKYPLILNVHGGPQSQWADAYRGDWQVYPGKGYVVAFPNPTGSSGRGQDFLDAIACDWGGRVFDDLMKVTDALDELPYVDSERQGAMGWSYGGYMMMWFAGHTQRFAALASMMGVYDLRSMWGGTEELWFPEHDLCGVPWTSDDYERWTPSASMGKFSTPTLVLTGERDFRVPYTQSLQFFTALQRRGVPSRLVVFPKSGHWPGWKEMAFYYNAHLDWFHRYLGGGAAPWDVHEMARNRAQPGWGKKGGE